MWGVQVSTVSGNVLHNNNSNFESKGADGSLSFDFVLCGRNDHLLICNNSNDTAVGIIDSESAICTDQ